MEQGVLVEALLDQDPAAAERLCPDLPAGSPAAFRCERKRTRPHLDVQLEPDAPPVAAAPDQADPVGPGMQRLSPPPPGPLPWDEAGPEEVAAAGQACAGHAVPEQCAEERAAALVAEGRLRDAGLACVALDPAGERAHDECLFRTAEALARTHQPPDAAAALALCARNRWFGRMCTSHVLSWLAPEQAVAGDSPDVAGAEALAEALSGAAGADPALAAAYADQFWGRWTANVALRRPEQLDATFAALPPEAAVHVRMARAYRLALDLDQSEAAAAPLDELAARLDQPWRRPRGRPAVASFGPQALPEGWAADLPGEEALPQVACLGPRRRALSEDPATDARIAVLEALAMRAPPPPAARFFDLVGSDEPELVRWTAARLGRRLHPSWPVAQADPSALVQQRLAWAPAPEAR